jgi:hypothetical protein
MFQEMERLIDDAKPLSPSDRAAHPPESRGQIYVGAYARVRRGHHGLSWSPDSIESTGGPFIACATHINIAEIMSIYP